MCAIVVRMMNKHNIRIRIYSNVHNYTNMWIEGNHQNMCNVCQCQTHTKFQTVGVLLFSTIGPLVGSRFPLLTVTTTFQTFDENLERRQIRHFNGSGFWYTLWLKTENHKYNIQTNTHHPRTFRWLHPVGIRPHIRINVRGIRKPRNGNQL